MSDNTLPLPHGAKLLYSAADIQARVAEIAAQLNGMEKFQREKPVVITCLKGAWIFSADLVRKLNFRINNDNIPFSSYDGKKSTGVVRMYSEFTMEIKGRHVIVVEDILDTRRSMKAVVDHLKSKGAASITIVSLLDKPSRQETDFVADDVIIGFSIEDLFVIGYGLDYDQDWRQLPDLYYLENAA